MYVRTYVLCEKEGERIRDGTTTRRQLHNNADVDGDDDGDEDVVNKKQKTKNNRKQLKSECVCIPCTLQNVPPSRTYVNEKSKLLYG